MGRDSRLSALQRRVDRLQASVQSVESIRAIKRLQNAYGHYAELGPWNDFADLFADDAIAYYPAGKLEGKQAVRKLFFDQVGRGKLGLDEGRLYPHIMLQPVITLAADGRTAKGRWRVLAMLGAYGKSASWASGLYENEYVQKNGVWSIGTLRYDTKVSAAYDAAGWKDAEVKVPFHYDVTLAGTPAPSAAVTPDAGGAPTLASLAQRAAGLAQRAARLGDRTRSQTSSTSTAIIWIASYGIRWPISSRVTRPWNWACRASMRGEPTFGAPSTNSVPRDCARANSTTISSCRPSFP